MEIRWTNNSVRFRISPPELELLMSGEAVRTSLSLPTGIVWQAAVVPAATKTGLRFSDNLLCLELSEPDVRRLAEPDREGVYFGGDGAPSVRYFIEKDFPCAHPRSAESDEPAHETFAAPEGFEARKQGG